MCNHTGVFMDMMGYMFVVSYFLYVLYFKNWCNILLLIIDDVFYL